MLANLINAFLPPQQRSATIQTLGHPSAGIIGWWGGEKNTTGEVVNEDTALTFAAFWCGVRVIAEVLASLPCIMYERVGESDKRRATNDNRYTLMHDNPNEELDAYHFIEVSTAHQVVWGNSYSKIVRDGFNDPMSLELRLPDRTEPNRRSDGQLIYDCSDPRETIEAPDCLHGTGFSFDGIKGYSVVEKMAQTLGIAIASDKYVGSTMKNGGVPSGVLDMPMRLGKPAREELRREWDEIHGGASKASRLAITHGGMKYVPISMNNKDAELLGMRKFSVVDVARILRLPLYILADLENSGVRANIEQQAIDLIAYSLMPWVKRWEGMLRMKLLNRNERKRYLFEFLMDSLLRSDTLTRYQAYALERQWGFGNVNEIRQRENRNSIGDNGDIYLEPLNMKPAGSESFFGKEKEEKSELPETIREEYRKSLAETINQTVDVAKQMKSAIQEGFTDIQGAFTDFGALLQQTTSSERETFNLIKQDIAELGTKVAVRVPEVPGQQMQSGVIVHFFEQAIGLQLRIEGTEALKAARGQMKDKSQNFIKRMDGFYDTHVRRVTDSLRWVEPQRADRDTLIDAMVGDHIDKSKADLLDCTDGNRDEFDVRVKKCTERWLSERVQSEAKEFHDRIYGAE